MHFQVYFKSNSYFNTIFQYYIAMLYNTPCWRRYRNAASITESNKKKSRAPNAGASYPAAETAHVDLPATASHPSPTFVLLHPPPQNTPIAFNMAAAATHAPRWAAMARDTNETKIQLAINLDGGAFPPDTDARLLSEDAAHASQNSKSQTIAVNTGIGFLDHMLHALAKHAGWSLAINCVGDLHSPLPPTHPPTHLPLRARWTIRSLFN